MAHEVVETAVALPDGAAVVVVGGGPAGAFFAIRLLRLAREAGKRIEVLILEKKRELNFYQPALPLVACGDVHMHVRSRKALADVMTANRLNQRLADCAHALHVNAERHLRSRPWLTKTLD